MKKIGILGEHPQNDAQAMKVLIEKSGGKFLGKHQFKIILKSTRGSQLDSPKALKMFRIECKNSDFENFIYVRDLDGMISEKKKVEARDKRFFDFSKAAGKIEGFFFLAIYSLESIILADIETFNKIYGTKVKYSKNPLSQNKPKEFLINKTIKAKRKYEESHCIEIFEKLDFEKVKTNHKGERSFAEFIENLEGKLK
jgi:hypothetical protein